MSIYRALIATEAPLDADELRRDLADAGIDIVAECTDALDLARSAMRHSADLVVGASVSPSAHLFEAARLLGTLAPCPFILFTSDRDAGKITRGAECGMHAYVVDGYAKHRLLSIIQVARARFHHNQVMRDELRGLSQRFDERKVVDRAKGVLMRSRGITEDETFEVLRSLAMRSRQRIGVAAQSVIDMSRASEAVNRAGQLRMLSQRIVKCYAQAASGFDATAARQALADSVVRVQSNLRILRKAISADGYGELVDRVSASWEPMLALCTAEPKLAGVAALDARGDAMLASAESLTEFLGSSGLVANLNIINVSGRQRMLGQRMAKLCFLLAIEPDAAQLTELRGLMAAFEAAMSVLARVPLTSPQIRASLEPASAEWGRLRSALESISEAGALREVADSSERLLGYTERLTDEYERAMQVLIGDRLGRLG